MREWIFTKYFHFHKCLILACIWDFRQTTSVTRVGGPGGVLKVRVEIDKLGDLKLKISDLFGGRKIMGKINWNWFWKKMKEKNYNFVNIFDL